MGSAWLPRWHARKLRAGWMLDTRAGWIRTEDEAKVVKGLLPGPSGWVPEDEALRLRAMPHSPWEIDWGEWLVRSNLPMAETLHCCQLLLEAGSRIRECEATRLTIKVEKPLHAFFFRNQADYEADVDLLGSGRRNLKDALGFYALEDRTLRVLWKGHGETGPLVRHEAGHALWSTLAVLVARTELRAAAVREAVALCLEEWELKQARWSQDVKYKSLYPELRGILQAQPQRRKLLDLVWLPDKDFQALPLAESYPYCRAVGDFFLLHPEVRLAEGFLEYVAACYQRSAHIDDLPALVGVPLEKLEADWSAFLDRIARGEWPPKDEGEGK